MTDEIPGNGATQDPAPAEQIPLLEDVMFEYLPLAAHPVKPKVLPRTGISLSKPITTDLFPEIVILNRNTTRSDPELQAEAVEMADNLARAYSREVIRKLRDELTLLLSDLNYSTPEVGSDKGDNPTV